MANVNFASQYESALLQLFKQNLRSTDLYYGPNQSLIKWTGAKSIRVPNLIVSGFADTDRGAQTLYNRTVDNNWQSYDLAHDRTFKTAMDPMDIDETNLAFEIANITGVFNTEKRIPEMDAYLYSKLVSDFVLYGGTPVLTVPTVGNILGLFDDMMQALDDAEAPEEGRILYVTNAIDKLLKQATGLVRNIETTQNNGDIMRIISMLDTVKIVKVHPSRMNTSYNFTLGFIPTGDQINMMLIHPSAVLAPLKYNLSDVANPSAVTDGKYLVHERQYWDVFLIETRFNAMAVNVAP